MYANKLQARGFAVLQTRIPQRRTFTCATTHLHSATTGATPRSSPPKPRIVKSGQAASLPSSTHESPRTLPPPPKPQTQPKPRRAPPAPIATTPVSRRQPTAADQVLGTDSQLCLYKAPPHTALALSSYACGSMMYGYAGNMVNMTFISSSATFWPMVLISVCSTAISVFATAVTLTPLRMLKRVDLIKGENGEARLRFEGRRALPFLKPKVFEATPDDVRINKSVAGSLLSYESCSAAKAQFWTHNNVPNPSGLSFQNMVRAMAKMFYRENILYLRVGHANWKLDLLNCQLLENGSPLMQVVKQDEHVRDNIFRMVRRAAGRVT